MIYLALPVHRLIIHAWILLGQLSQLWLYLAVILVPAMLHQMFDRGGPLLQRLTLIRINLKVSLVPRIEGHSLTTQCAIVPVLLDLQRPHRAIIAMLLQDHDRVRLLRRLGATEDRCNIEICVIVDLLGVDDQEHVNVLVSCELAQSCDHLVL